MSESFLDKKLCTACTVGSPKLSACTALLPLLRLRGDREENLPTHSHLTHFVRAGDMGIGKFCKWALTWLTHVTARLTSFHQARGWRWRARDVSTFTLPVILWVFIICSFLPTLGLLCPHPQPTPQAETVVRVLLWVVLTLGPLQVTIALWPLFLLQIIASTAEGWFACEARGVCDAQCAGHDMWQTF